GLGAADVALLDRAWTGRVGEDALRIDAEFREHFADAAAILVGPDDAGEHDAGAEGAEQGGHARSAAEALLAAVGLEEQHRRLLTDAGGVAPDVAVEHDVADDQHARLPEVLHQFDQIAGHGGPPCPLNPSPLPPPRFGEGAGGRGSSPLSRKR